MKPKKLPYIPMADRKRFWARVDKNGPVPAHRPDLGPCWLWKLARGGDPRPFCYGSFRYRGEDFPAHRVALLLARGRVSRILQPDHLCFRYSCVNPGHIEEVTAGVNVLRSYRAREIADFGRAPFGTRVFEALQ
jgi:hypothetical protein